MPWFKVVPTVTEIPSTDLTGLSLVEGVLPDGTILIEAEDASTAVQEYRVEQIVDPVLPMHRVVMSFSGVFTTTVEATSSNEAVSAGAAALTTALTSPSISSLNYSMTSNVRIV